MKYMCPVCFYDAMPYPAVGYDICPCCGTEFGNDDFDASHEQLRAQWVGRGMPWFFRTPPLGWNPLRQTMLGGFYNPALAFVPVPTAAQSNSISVSGVPYWLAGEAMPKAVYR